MVAESKCRVYCCGHFPQAAAGGDREPEYMAEDHQQDRPESRPEADSEARAGRGAESPSSSSPPPPSSDGKRSADREARFVHPLGSARELAGVGIEIVAAIAGLGLVGFALDYWLQTSPWLMAIGMILGIIGGLYNAVKKALNITGLSPYERKRNDDQPGGK